MDSTEKISRFLICLCAVTLLWLTTAQKAVDLAVESVNTPTIGYVLSSCGAYWDELRTQKQDYAFCANDQLKSCGIELDVETQKQMGSMDTRKKKARAHLTLIEGIQQASSNLLTQAISSINNYKQKRVRGGLLFNCSSRAQEKEMDALLDGQGIEAGLVQNQVRNYTRQSDSRVQQLVDYTKTLLGYNEEYVTNKSRVLLVKSTVVVNKLQATKVPGVKTKLTDISTAIDSMVGCLSMDSSSTCNLNGAISLKGMYTDAQVTVNTKLASIEEAVSSFNTEFNDFKTKVSLSLTKAKELVSATQSIVNYVVSTTAGFGVSNELCSKTTPDWCEFSAADFVVNAPKSINLGTIHKMPLPAELWDKVKAVVPLTTEQISNLSLDVENSVKALVREAISSIESIDVAPTDYNPPQYVYATNTSVESDSQQQASSQFQRNINRLLNGDVKENNLSMSFSATSSANFTLKMPISSSEALLSDLTSLWMPFNKENLRVLDWLWAVKSLLDLLYTIDFLFRCFATLRIIYKHWNATSGRLPPTDIRANGNRNIFDGKHDNRKQIQAMSTGKSSESRHNDTKEEKQRPYITLMLHIADKLGLQLLLISLISVFFFVTIVVLYVASFDAYKSACVTHSSNSTLLLRTMNSAGYNFASIDGNSLLTRGISEYNQDVIQKCSSYTKGASDLHTQYNTRLREIQRIYARNIAKMKIVETCLSGNDTVLSMNRFYKEQCCHHVDYHRLFADECAEVRGTLDEQNTSRLCPLDPILGSAALPVSSHLSALDSLHTDWLAANALDPAMNLQADNSEDSNFTFHFNCSELPKCFVSCGGPDKKLVVTRSQGCACGLEWYLHAHVARIALVVLIFVSMNISRLLLIKGLLKVCWKAINMSYFDCVISCDDKGVIFVNNILWSVESSKASVGDAIQCTVRKHEVEGWCCMGLALIINLPWLLCMHFFNNQVAYEPYDQTAL